MTCGERRPEASRVNHVGVNNVCVMAGVAEGGGAVGRRGDRGPYSQEAPTDGTTCETP